MSTVTVVVTNEVESMAPAAPLPDGVYLGLPEDAYHADSALGSGDMKRLYQQPQAFWFLSKFNPYRKPKATTPAMLFGKAIHKFVLEGRAAFEREYAALDHSGATREGKAERVLLAALGKTGIKREEYDEIGIAGSLIRIDPELGEGFQNGQPEVSVVWTRDGIRRKARLDYLKLNAIVDLKSISNPFEEEFTQVCRTTFARRHMYLQAAHYNEGRTMLRQFVQTGQVYGLAPERSRFHDPALRAWLDEVAAVESWSFVFVFYQTNDPPLVWGAILTPENPTLEWGRACIQKAEYHYETFMKHFGPNTPWLLIESLRELAVEELPAWAGRI